MEREHGSGGRRRKNIVMQPRSVRLWRRLEQAGDSTIAFGTTGCMRNASLARLGRLPEISFGLCDRIGRPERSLKESALVFHTDRVPT
uniref:Uncharacterized protein n=1 Tax=Chromera velia CCMP2878 TaxID=1169474 RepID=A0A0G4HXK2_9ALVE|eukprot:Cvel_9281.t1-p1 / transcript=Cvel_9281.t1 / gene=Cvel_9281 / organism=Chromera_velia_CCMP2878 / gene_product=hypothetical protein / transcript_product=hypothetical protein / location=Cvel_scaffold530:80426-81081(-) / protein_length=87 / sequence_SO=supercontig / SO=protein_coding / is_pseudo=false